MLVLMFKPNAWHEAGLWTTMLDFKPRLSFGHNVTGASMKAEGPWGGSKWLRESCGRGSPCFRFETTPTWQHLTVIQAARFQLLGWQDSVEDFFVHIVKRIVCSAALKANLKILRVLESLGVKKLEVLNLDHVTHAVWMCLALLWWHVWHVASSCAFWWNHPGSESSCLAHGNWAFPFHPDHQSAIRTAVVPQKESCAASTQPIWNVEIIHTKIITHQNACHETWGCFGHHFGDATFEEQYRIWKHFTGLAMVQLSSSEFKWYSIPNSEPSWKHEARDWIHD